MIKEIMVRSMDKIMLNCEEATYLITKSEIEDIGCTKRIQLKMHLMGCSFCRRFKIQSEFIDHSLKTLESLKISENNQEIATTLSKDKKEELQQIIKDNS